MQFPLSPIADTRKRCEVGDEKGDVLVEMERRLAAIMAADLVGYSRHMSLDEEGTLRRLAMKLSEVIQPEIVSRRGRIVKTTGDGFLAEFDSVFNAFNCALAIQETIALRQENSADEKMQFRIGLNVGDIIRSGGDIFGDGVNVAARLEGIAEPGGIAVSARAWEDLKRTRIIFKDEGEQVLKNIPEPVRVYSVDMAQNPRPGSPPIGVEKAIPSSGNLADIFAKFSVSDLAALIERASGPKRDSLATILVVVLAAIFFLVLKSGVKIVGLLN